MEIKHDWSKLGGYPKEAPSPAGKAESPHQAGPTSNAVKSVPDDRIEPSSAPSAPKSVEAASRAPEEPVKPSLIEKLRTWYSGSKAPLTEKIMTRALGLALTYGGAKWTGAMWGFMLNTPSHGSTGVQIGSLSSGDLGAGLAILLPLAVFLGGLAATFLPMKYLSR